MLVLVCWCLWRLGNVLRLVSCLVLCMFVMK